MGKIVEIPVERLTADAFAPYGQVLEEFSPEIRAVQGRKATKTLDFVINGAVELDIVRYDQQPMEFYMLERHLTLTETRVPLTPSTVVVIVGAPTRPVDRAVSPPPESLRAFVLNGRQGVLLWRGTWHALDCFPVSSPYADFAFVCEVETESEWKNAPDLSGCQRSHFVDLRRELDLQFKVVDPAGFLKT